MVGGPDSGEVVMILFAVFYFVVAGGVFWLLLRTQPAGAVLAVLRALALAVLGLVLLWSGCGVAAGLQEYRRIEAWRAERARREEFAIPVSDIEILDPTLGPGGERGRPVMEARIRNRSTSRTLYLVSYRWSVSYCASPDSCKPVGGTSQLALDGVRPGQDYRARVETTFIDIGPQGVSILKELAVMRRPATIELIEARGR